MYTCTSYWCKTIEHNAKFIIIFICHQLLSVAHLSLECVIWIIKAINDNHLVIGSVLGVDLNEQTESVDSEILPVVATGAMYEASDSLARFLYQGVVGIDAGDRSNTLVRNGCANINVHACRYMYVQCTCTVGGMYGNS